MVGDSLQSKRFLIDSGSTASLIKRESLPNHWRISPKGRVNIRGVTGDTRATLGTIRLPFRFEDKIFTRRFFILPLKFPLDSDGILGADFLAAHGATLDYARETLSVGGAVAPFNKQKLKIKTKDRQVDFNPCPSKEVEQRSSLKTPVPLRKVPNGTQTPLKPIKSTTKINKSIGSDKTTRVSFSDVEKNISPSNINTIKMLNKMGQKDPEPKVHQTDPERSTILNIFSIKLDQMELIIPPRSEQNIELPWEHEALGDFLCPPLLP